MSRLILILLIAVFVVSYIIWKFDTLVMGKNVSLSEIATWVLGATFLIFIFFAGLSYLIEGS